LWRLCEEDLGKKVNTGRVKEGGMKFIVFLNNYLPQPRNLNFTGDDHDYTGLAEKFPGF
jgi:hypothetical protein